MATLVYKRWEDTHKKLCEELDGRQLAYATDLDAIVYKTEGGEFRYFHPVPELIEAIEKDSLRAFKRHGGCR